MNILRSTVATRSAIFGSRRLVTSINFLSVVDLFSGGCDVVRVAVAVDAEQIGEGFSNYLTVLQIS